MFLESCGKFFFSRKQYIPFLFYAFLVLPVFLSGAYLFMKHAGLQQLEARIMDAKTKGKTAIEKKNRKERFIKRFANADPFFLDKHIESLQFLQTEAAQLESLILHPAVVNKRALQERLNFLNSKQNRLVFSEENIRSSSKIKETEEKQRHPVQMDEADLQRLCAYIEDVPIGPHEPLPHTPQLVVREMRIKKTNHSLHSTAYEVELELLKREWVQ